MKSHSRVAFRHLQRVALVGDLQEMLLELSQLEKLDENLTDVLDTFESNFRMASKDTEVASQFEALSKARAGLEKAQQIAKNVAGLVELYPEDKTAQRAAKDADVMIRRFQRHEADAAKMIRTLSKKTMPTDLVKAAKSFGGAIQRILEDPKLLQVIPWQSPDQNWNTKVKGVQYQMVFRIPKQPGMRVHEKAEVILTQSTVDRKGVQFKGMDGGSSGRGFNEEFSLKAAKALMVTQLEGWAGMKGQADATSARTQYVNGIKDALRSAARRISRDVRDVEVSSDFRDFSVEFRTGLDSRDYGQYDESYSEEAEERYSPKFVAALKPYASVIQKQYISSEGYKGYWTYSVRLK